MMRGKGMNKIKRIFVAALAFSVVTATPAAAAAKPYHIWNVPESRGQVNIYGWTGCNPSGPIHILDPGEDADSYGWDSFKVYGIRRFNVIVFDYPTGRWLADRTYDPGTCVRAYDNSYRVQVL